MTMRIIFTDNLNDTEIDERTLMKYRPHTEKPIVISSERCPNMEPIYKDLLSCYKGDFEVCPTVYLCEKIEDRTSYLKCKDILLLKRGCQFENTMRSDNYSHRSDFLRLCSFERNAALIYSLALDVCNLLHIRCPLILPSDTLYGVRGEAFQNSSNSTKLILLKTGMPLNETIQVLCHELRHAWQHEKAHKMFFKDYRPLNSGIDLKSYSMQHAELDAEAFSRWMMYTLGLKEYPAHWNKDEDINQKVEERVAGLRFSADKDSLTYFTAAVLELGDIKLE